MPSRSISIRVAMCQMNPVVGDIEGNTERIIEAMTQARGAGADVVVFPELAITGYPPEDLLLKPQFVTDNLLALERIAGASGVCLAVVGFVDRTDDLYNAAAVCHRGMVAGKYHKQILPNYGPFDEQRYFRAADPPQVLYVVGGIRIGITVCEDAWFADGPIAHQSAGGAELIVNLNASPYFRGRIADRQKMLAARAVEAEVPIVYVNQVGGQDELVFDGGSMIMGSDGLIVASAAQFVEEMLVADIDVPQRSGVAGLAVLPLRPERPSRAETIRALVAAPMAPNEEVYSALVLGLRDYVIKNGFSEVVIGLSGGIDSSLVSVLATDAIGSANVHGVMMPSRYSTEGSIDDAVALADNLGIDLRTIPIEAAHESFGQMLDDSLSGRPVGLTDENLQSRIRGVTLMALSNQFGWLVLTTGNKSELAVGYSTLYGDTAGGFAVIKDVSKTQVYELCHWRNEVDSGAVIPLDVLTKAPSAELRPDQTDQDSLPPYEVLDPILAAYVEDDRSASEIEGRGFDGALVRRIVRMVDLAEYKRRQSPIGVRVTPKAFGRDRRVPITNQYSG